MKKVSGMANSSNKLSFEDISEEDLNFHFEEIAMDYLMEINDLKDDVATCHHKLKEEKIQKLDMKTQNQNLRDLVRNLKYELRQKTEDINVLKEDARNAFLRKPGETQPRMVHVDPGDISFKTKLLIRKIHEQHGEYLKTGQQENIDENIAEVRELFNLVLIQLNELNSKNKAVTRTLESLTKLDVN